MQQLASNPVFRQFQDQPDKLLAVLQHDQVLAEAAAGNPEIAALLDPSTLKQALAVLQGSSGSSSGAGDPQQQGVPVLQCKALMHLQNYAQQLQQARLAGLGPPPITLQHHHQQQAQSQASPTSSGGAQSAAADSDMWAAMQERFSKLQQRSSMLGAMPGVQQGVHSSETSATLPDTHARHACCC